MIEEGRTLREDEAEARVNLRHMKVQSNRQDGYIPTLRESQRTAGKMLKKETLLGLAVRHHQLFVPQLSFCL